MIDWRKTRHHAADRWSDLLRRCRGLWHRQRRRGTRGCFAVRFGFFGKHPGWKDYFDGHLPLEGAGIGRFKKALEASIRRQLLEAGQPGRLPFDHLACWRCGRRILVARIWESHDQQNQRRFPMIACMEFHGWPTEPALAFAGPRLNRIATLCLETADPDRVRKLCVGLTRSWRALAERRGPRFFRPAPAERAAAATESPASLRDGLRQLRRVASLRLRPQRLLHLRADLGKPATQTHAAAWLRAAHDVAGRFLSAVVVSKLNESHIDLSLARRRGVSYAFDAMTLDPCLLPPSAAVHEVAGRIDPRLLLGALSVPPFAAPATLPAEVSATGDVDQEELIDTAVP